MATLKLKPLFFTSILLISIFIAYHLGGLWASQKNIKINSDESISKAPKTVPFQLQNNITSAWDLPAFHLKDTSGKTRTLEEWKGKLIMLNFWATWCPPCRYEIPEFMQYQTEFETDGLQIIGIGIGDEREIKNFARTFEINYPILISESPQLMLDWGNKDQIMPYTILIDRAGKIRYIHRGQLSKTSFKYEITPLLKNNVTSSGQ